MKPFTFAIASIVDSNTGYGLPRGGGIDYESIERASRKRRATAFINLLVRARSAVSTLAYRLRKRRELARSLRELSALNDRMLEDIGFTRGDVLAAQSGQLDRNELELRREHNRGKRPVRLHAAVSTAKNENPVQAINEAVFARAKCA